MSRFVPSVALSLLLVATSLFGVVSLGAQPAEARENTKAAAPTALVGTASNLAREASIIFLANANATTALRAIVVVRDSNDALVGCGIRTLRPGDNDWLYISNSTMNVPVDVLSVKAYGVSATGPLIGRLDPQAGLIGSIAQVQEADGATRAVYDMFDIATSNLDLQTDLDACLTGGATALGGGRASVSDEQPAGWSRPTSAPASASSKKK
jgi:hypothetical protein